MSTESSGQLMDKHDEILALIETLHQTSQRLEELTAGEIDTVSNREGRTFMLRLAQDQFHESEMVRQAAILNALPAHIALLDTQGCILSVNEAWRQYGSANMLQDAAYCVGRNYLNICESLPAEFDTARRVGAGIRAVMSGEEKYLSLEYPCHSPTQQYWFLVTVTPLDGGNPRRVVVVHEDITSRKLAEFRLYRLNRLHSVLSKVGEAIVRTDDKQKLYESICGIFVEFGLLHMAVVAHVDTDAGVAQVSASFGAGLESLRESTFEIPMEDGLFGRGTVGTAIRTGAHDFCNDVGSDARMKPWRDAALQSGLLANAAFPLKSHGIVVAVLVLHANEINFFQDDELSLMDAVANEISFALEGFEVEQERRVAEQQIQRSAGLLTMASRMGRLGAWTVDLPSRAVTWSNEVYSIHARPFDFVPTLDSALATYPPEFRPRISSALNACIEDGTSFDLELQIYTVAENRIWVRCIGEALKKADGEIHQIRGAFQDISDQKRTEEGLRLSEERFRGMFSSAITGIAISTPTGRYIQANAAYCHMLGYTESELLERNFASVTHPDDLAFNLQMRDELTLGKRDSFTMEKRYLKKNGIVIWTRLSVSALRRPDGEVVTLMVIAEDVTERRLAQEALQQQQTELRVLFDLMPAMLCFKDTSNRFLRVNQRLADSTGRAVSDMEGKSAEELYPNDAGKYYADDLQVIHSRAPRLGIVEELRSKEGDVIWIQTDKVPYCNQDDKVIGLVVLSQDITERKREQDELRELNFTLEDRVRERTAALHAAREEAEQATRAKSDFLAAMSHEIRTPMNGVIGLIDVIYQSNLQPYQLEMLDLIRESGFALQRIVDDILDFSKIEAGKLDIEKTSTSITDVVEKAAAVFAHLALKNKAELLIFVDPEIPQVVLGDGLRLRQVLINLIGNAIKFSSGREQKGRISVRAALIGADVGRAEILIEVADNGIGMDEKAQARLFSAFSQADSSITRRFGGTGLGLVISRNLVELMQGEFSLHSVPDQGTTFSIKLPLALPLTQSNAGDYGESGRLPDVTGLSCMLIASPDELLGNIAAYLTYAGARLEHAADLTSLRCRMEVIPHGPCIWIVMAALAPLPLSELRALAQSYTEHEIHIIVIDRESCAAPQSKFSDLSFLGGNILTRYHLLQSISIAAGRGDEPARITSDADFGAPSRNDAQRDGRLILIAEDNEINQMVVVRQLALLGFAADVAESGSRALGLWRRGNYALLLSDLHMPDMDGYQLATRIRHEEHGDRRIPIVALSADALKGQDARCRAAGMDDYLSKPLRIDALEATLNKWLKKSAGITETVDTVEDTVGHPQQSTPQAVDLGVLKSFIGDDPFAIPGFVNSFRNNAVKLAATLTLACLDGNMQRASRAVHTLKSSAHYVGALELSAICVEMENAANQSDSAALAALLPDFEQEFDQVIKFFDSLELPNASPGERP